MLIINYNYLCVYLLFEFFMSKTNPWSSFKSISSSEWMDKIIKDLKGKPFKDLIWKASYGNIDPTVISSKYTNISYNPTEEISWEFSNDLKLNTNILEALNNGVNSIYLNNIPYNESVFNNVMNEIIYTHLNIEKLNINQQTKWVNWVKSNRFNGSIRNTIHPSYLIYDKAKFNFNNYKKLNDDLQDHNMNCLYVDGEYFSHRIFEMDKELAWVAAYFNELIEYNLINDIAIPKKIIISTSLGTSLFENIAKIKAIFVITNTIINAHGIKSSIEVETSFNRIDVSPLEKEHHILRLTVACMSSIIAGSIRIKLANHDAIFEENYWKKIACNIPLILKEESYLFIDDDASKGCYIVNQIERMLSESAWTKFKEIEKNGGLCSSSNKKIFQKTIDDNHIARLENLKGNKKTFVGFNSFSSVQQKFDFYSDFKPPLFLKDLIK